MARTVFALWLALVTGAAAQQQQQPPGRQRPAKQTYPLPPEKIPGDPKPPAAPLEEGEKPKPQTSPDDPPEEDESLKPKVYDFNPLQADKSMAAGEFYYKKGKYPVAVKRFREAGLYNPSLAESFYRLGEAYEKNHQPTEAIEAYRKYVELAPDSKKAAALKKKLDLKPGAKKN